MKIVLNGRTIIQDRAVGDPLVFITDRTAEDVATIKRIRERVKNGYFSTEFDNTNYKGCFNAYDLNRIEDIMVAIASLAYDKLHVTLYITPRTWSVNEVPAANKITSFLEDLNHINGVSPGTVEYEDVEYTVPDPPASLDNMTIDTANNIEIMLFLIGYYLYYL